MINQTRVHVCPAGLPTLSVTLSTPADLAEYLATDEDTFFARKLGLNV